MEPEVHNSLEISRITAATPRESEEARRFLAERLRFFGRTVFIISTMFMVLVNLAGYLARIHGLSYLLTSAANLLHLAINLSLIGTWLLPGRRLHSYRSLRLLDSWGMLFLSVGLSLMIIFQDQKDPLGMGPILSLTNLLLARAVTIPSDPLRTAWIGSLASIPALIAAALRLPSTAAEVGSAFHLFITSLWYFTAVVISTVASQIIFGLRREVREARRLGQYTLEERIGSGGMGEVFRASHALLRRPTAIKLLKRAATDERSLARFEREVQLTSRLFHPNTIAIYDYGRTPDGIFYYAMEYLPGINLDELVRRDGPQPAGRVIHILKQICASLHEAHGLGLIHRDIKGANVILCERGGIPDVAKVLDFGLVKEMTVDGRIDLSGANTITGTPLYLSPEAIQSPDHVDGRSDLYAVGVLGYYLLTGTHVFEGKNFIDICSHHLHSPPDPPSRRLPRPADPAFEAILLRCLEKEPARRHADARALWHDLAAAPAASEWGDAAARDWWVRFERGEPAAKPVEPPTKSVATAEYGPAGRGEA